MFGTQCSGNKTKYVSSIWPILITWLLVSSSPIYAETDSNQDNVMLEVTGNLSPSMDEDTVIILRRDVEKLPQKSITTTSHITDDPITYSGPLFTDLLNLAGAQGDLVTVVAWDDYLAEIKVEDLNKYGVILATHENGKQLSMENRGPMYVVFPFSDYPEIRNDLYYNKSVWQIKTIEVE